MDDRNVGMNVFGDVYKLISMCRFVIKYDSLNWYDTMTNCLHSFRHLTSVTYIIVKTNRVSFFQVRERAKLNAAKIRQSVKEEKQKQLQKLAKEIEVGQRYL